MKVLQISILGSIFALSLHSFPSLALELTLQSSDGQNFEIEVGVARQSETLKNLIEDAGVKDAIPLPNITGKILSHVVKLMKELQGSAGEPSEKKRKVTENTDEPLQGLIHRLWAKLTTSEVFDLVVAVNYLDIRKKQENDVLYATLPLYGDRIFSDAELRVLGTMNDYVSYQDYKKRFALHGDLQRIVLKRSWENVDRIFLDTSPNRRILALDQTPLGVAQIVAYIAKNQTPTADKLPEGLRSALADWDKDFASKIHFGPWPTEWATWPAHCPLSSDPNYNMYSDTAPNERYVDNGDGTITDVCTKLTWEQAPSTKLLPWEKAKAYCETLNKADLTDWRLPTLIELQSIVDYSAENPALNSIFSITGKVFQFWSGSNESTNQVAWNVNFRQGHTSFEIQKEKYRARCVRGERAGELSNGAKSHYSYKGQEEVLTDNFTGAKWQRGSFKKEEDHSQLRESCQNLKLNELEWQLPTVKTLSTLFDAGSFRVKIDVKAFPMENGHWFFLSFQNPRYPNIPLLINFEEGEVTSQINNVFMTARCVHWDF